MMTAALLGVSWAIQSKAKNAGCKPTRKGQKSLSCCTKNPANAEKKSAANLLIFRRVRRKLVNL
jgi:hypothetical protein